MNSGPIRNRSESVCRRRPLPISVGAGRGVGPHVVVKAGAVAADVPIAVAAVAANSIGAETAAKVAIAAVITETPIAAITTDSVAAEIPAADVGAEKFVRVVQSINILPTAACEWLEERGPTDVVENRFPIQRVAEITK